MDLRRWCNDCKFTLFTEAVWMLIADWLSAMHTSHHSKPPETCLDSVWLTSVLYSGSSFSSTSSWKIHGLNFQRWIWRLKGIPCFFWLLRSCRRVSSRANVLRKSLLCNGSWSLPQIDNSGVEPQLHSSCMKNYHGPALIVSLYIICWTHLICSIHSTHYGIVESYDLRLLFMTRWKVNGIFMKGWQEDNILKVFCNVRDKNFPILEPKNTRPFIFTNVEDNCFLFFLTVPTYVSFCFSNSSPSAKSVNQLSPVTVRPVPFNGWLICFTISGALLLILNGPSGCMYTSMLYVYITFDSTTENILIPYLLGCGEMYWRKGQRPLKPIDLFQ